jgi:L-fuconolactonase
MAIHTSNQASALAATMFDEVWLARHREDILEPSLPIIDAHHHCQRRPDVDYLLDPLIADLKSGHNVVATVYIECASMYRKDGLEALRPVGETDFVNGIAAMSASGLFGGLQACAGIVGHADLRLGTAVREVLEAHLRVAGPRFRGIRHIAAFDPLGQVISVAAPPSGLLTDPRFHEGFAELAPLGLTFDAWVYHPLLPDLIALAKKFPETDIVVNHVGGPLGTGSYETRLPEVFATWRSSMRTLADLPNVFVKLGGMGMRQTAVQFNKNPEPPTSQMLADTWRPYVETCIEAFGVERCMFESNFPVDKRTTSYPVLWNAFKRLASGCSAVEKTALFSGTAARFYRLSPA